MSKFPVSYGNQSLQFYERDTTGPYSGSCQLNPIHTAFKKHIQIMFPYMPRISMQCSILILQKKNCHKSFSLRRVVLRREENRN